VKSLAHLGLIRIDRQQEKDSSAARMITYAKHLARLLTTPSCLQDRSPVDAMLLVGFTMASLVIDAEVRSMMRVQGCRARVANRLADSPSGSPRCAAVSKRRPFLAGQRMRQRTGRAREVSPLRLQTQNLTIASKAARVNGEQVSVLGWLWWRLSVRRVAKLRRMIISKLFMLLSVAFAGRIRRSSFKGRTARPIRAFDS
jgi:hypothetical protein